MQGLLSLRGGMRLCRWLKCAGLAVCLVGGGLVATQGSAQVRGAFIVGNDRGGYVKTRVAQLERIRRAHQAVAITGNVCLSSCTMYLGAGEVCVRRETVFGFHGPSNRGVALGAEDFERWSQLIASYYRPALRRWYLETGRHRIRGYYRMTGANVIALGYPECD